MPTDPTQAVIDAVREAWTAGRPIVPVLGAGLSADAGIPVVASLKRYLCKYHQYVSRQCYLPGLPEGLKENPLGGLAERYRRQPADCVAEVGWPDRFELTQSLQSVAPGGDVEALVRQAEEQLVAQTHEWASKQLVDMHAAIRGQVDRLPASAARAELYRTLDERLVRGANGRHVAYDLFSNWRRLIQHFTDYRPELADGLFHRLVGGRRPSLGHRYLAFLVKLLGVRSVFTFNFDDLLERALLAEQVSFQAFAMEYGGALPHPALARDALTVVKMHGGTHALLLDERLDYPLAEEYKSRFRDLVGRRPLLLVAGFGTDERRLFDLLETTLTADDQSRVCWLHFEATVPQLLETFANKAAWRGRVLAAPTANPGQVFRHLYAALAGRHPASRVPYPSHIHRPFSYRPVDRAGLKRELGPASAAAFAVVTSTTIPDDQYPPRTASEWLIELATQGVRQGFQPLWVDLESSNTLAAVVGSVIDQCRALDAQLAPSVMPLGDLPAEQLARTPAEWAADPVVRAAARRVSGALRRSRYLVLLDGLEAYLWPPLVHHGEVASRADQDRGLLAQLGGFLTALKDELGPTSGSRVVIGVDRSSVRTGEWNYDKLTRKYTDLVDHLEKDGWAVTRLPADGNHPFKDTFRPPDPDNPLTTAPPPAGDPVPSDDRWALLLLTVSCVRRGRPLATVRRVLRPFVRGRAVDQLVARLCDPTNGGRLGFTRLEGGGLWYHRPVRDHVYAANSRGCGTQAMSRLLADPADPGARADEVRLAAAQAVLLAATHLRVAAVYYSNVYLQSLDAVPFLEYTYHRQSGIRYLAKLQALLGVRGYGPHVLAGIARAGRYDRPADAQEPPDDWLRLWEGLCPRATLPGTAMFRALTGAADGELAEKLRAELAEWHARELTALARAWVRAEPVLRVQLPTQQLVAWCDALTHETPSRLLDRVPVERDGSPSSYPPGDGPLTPQIGAAYARLVEVVTDFKVKLLYDRADYALAAGVRLDQLRVTPEWPAIAEAARALHDLMGPGAARAPEAGPGRPARVGEAVARAHLRHLHWLLDVAACAIKLRQEAGADPRHAVALLDVIGGLLEAAEAALPGRGIDDADAREARLRWHYFRAEAAVGDICVFNQSIGFLGRPAQLLPPAVLGQFQDNMARAERDIELGMTAMRAAPPRADGRLRSLMLDPIDGGWLYLPYRSAFHAFQGRLRWMRAVRTVGLSDEDRHEGFRTAFECFDLARGGLEGNHQIAALNELYLVEACLARSRMLLYPTADDSQAHLAEQLRQAGAKYEAARGGLQAARAHLLTGRRNVIWWKLFYALAAQYHADRLLTGMARLAGEPPDGAAASVRLWEVVARLRRGYQTVRSGLDLRATPDGTGDRGWAWLGRAWAEMTGAAYLTARYLIERAARDDRHPAARLSPADRHAAVLAGLAGLNRACRLDLAVSDLPGAAAADWAAKMRWYDDLFDGGKRPAAAALYVRANVLLRGLDPAWQPIWGYDELSRACPGEQTAADQQVP